MRRSSSARWTVFALSSIARSYDRSVNPGDLKTENAIGRAVGILSSIAHDTGSVAPVRGQEKADLVRVRGERLGEGLQTAADFNGVGGHLLEGLEADHVDLLVATQAQGGPGHVVAIFQIRGKDLPLVDQLLPIVGV